MTKSYGPGLAKRRRRTKLDFTFLPIAVTEQQIVDYDLPTRPTKKTDSRSKNFKGESVELDALPGEVLVTLVEDSIRSHVDPGRMARILDAELLARESFLQFAKGFKASALEVPS